jgi:hypothetical protein
MRTMLHSIRTLLLISFAVAVAHAASEPHYRNRGGNNIYAQALADQVVTQYPIVFQFYIHAIPPGAKESRIVAQIGALPFIDKPSSDIEASVATLDQVLVGNEPPYNKIPRYKVAVPLRDASGNIVGLALMSIRRGRLDTTPDDEGAAVTLGMKIAAELAPKITDQASLFKSTPVPADLTVN